MGPGSERITSSKRNWRALPGRDWGNERLGLGRAERVRSLACAAHRGTLPHHASAVANGAWNGDPRGGGRGLWGLWPRRAENARAILAPARGRPASSPARDRVSTERGRCRGGYTPAAAVGDDQPRQRRFHARGGFAAGLLLVVALVRGAWLRGRPAAAPRSRSDGWRPRRGPRYLRQS